MYLLQQLNAREIPLCLLFNRMNHLRPISRFFALISRLGNGVFWYCLILALPLLHGSLGIQAALHMLLVGGVGVLIYKLLKSKTHRVRPYHYHSSILQNVAALDQFSFPWRHPTRCQFYVDCPALFSAIRLSVNTLCGFGGVIAGDFRAALPQ